MTEQDIQTIESASKLYKEMVHMKGPDGAPGLNDKYEAADFYNAVINNFDDFEDVIFDKPVFNQYTCITDAFKEEWELFMYAFEDYVDEVLNGTINKDLPFNIDAEEEKKNKKEFIKEVMKGVERKKYLKDFLNDFESYKQYQLCIKNCLLYMNFEKIHAIMEALDWTWARWTDEEFDEQGGTVPSAFGIREGLISLLNNMEDYILNTNCEEYSLSCGGWEVNIHMVHDEDTPDDFNNQVVLTAKFVVESYDNC